MLGKCGVASAKPHAHIHARSATRWCILALQQLSSGRLAILLRHSTVHCKDVHKPRMGLRVQQHALSLSAGQHTVGPTTWAHYLSSFSYMLRMLAMLLCTGMPSTVCGARDIPHRHLTYHRQRTSYVFCSLASACGVL